MLMFQNGLLDTFIPEILMVAGYLFCLCAPGVKKEPSTSEINQSIVTQISLTQQTHSNTFITIGSDFQYEEAVFQELLKSPILKFVKVQKTFVLYLFELSDGLTFEQFSRPPPSLFC